MVSQVISQIFFYLSNRFKAREVNEKIVEMNGLYGVKGIPSPSPTEVKPFHFQLEQRMEYRRKSKDSKKVRV